MGRDSEMENRMTASWQGRLGVEGLSEKEKGLMDMDNTVVIARVRRVIRGLKGNEKNTIKIK